MSMGFTGSGYRLQVTGYRLQVTGYKLRVAGSRFANGWANSDP
jgi:hypothetical protein